MMLPGTSGPLDVVFVQKSAQPPPILYETAVPAVPGEVCNVSVVLVGTPVMKVNSAVMPVPDTQMALPMSAVVKLAPRSVSTVVAVVVLAVLDWENAAALACE